jgi:hypothetical protein
MLSNGGYNFMGTNFTKKVKTLEELYNKYSFLRNQRVVSKTKNFMGKTILIELEEVILFLDEQNRPTYAHL